MVSELELRFQCTCTPNQPWCRYYSL